jgi:hypothetical protein
MPGPKPSTWLWIKPMQDRGNIMGGLQPGIDAISIASILGAIVGWLPPIATLFAIVWYVLMIVEWFDKRRLARAERAAEALVAKAVVAAEDVLAKARNVDNTGV